MEDDKERKNILSRVRDTFIGRERVRITMHGAIYLGMFFAHADCHNSSMSHGNYRDILLLQLHALMSIY